MNTLTIIAMALLALVLLFFSVLLPLAIVFNLRAGERYRQGLAERIDRLRLGRMLAALGIDVNVYLSSERGLDIRDHIERCSACENTAECDDRLARNDVAPDSIGFCNNEASLRKISEK